MGNLEKLVVLVVLFLVAIVLGVTLNGSGGDTTGVAQAGPGGVARLERAEPSGPLDAARRRNGTELAPLPASVEDAPSVAAPASAPETAPQTAEVRTQTPLLNSTVRRPGTKATGAEGTRRTRPAREAEPKPAPAADGRILIARDGLLEIPGLSDCLRYSVQARDTWAGLSERFYGDRRYTDLLRQANDDPGALEGGMELLVPVYDLTRPAQERPLAKPVQRQSLAEAAVTSYTVVSGDSLSVISQKVYGTSRRWREIFEANRKALADEHTLQVGMELTVPR